MICPKCGCKIPDNSNSCNVCGNMIINNGGHTYPAYTDSQTQRGKVKPKRVRMVIEWVIAIALLGILACVVMVRIDTKKIEEKYENGFEELLVGTSFEVEDEYGHMHDVFIDSGEQVEVTSQGDVVRLGTYKYKISGKASVKIKTGTLENISVTVVVPFHGTEKQVEWTYKETNDDRTYAPLTDVSFDYEKEPTVTISDLMNYLNVNKSKSGKYRIATANLTGIGNEYDVAEFCVIYKENDVVYQQWARIEYDEAADKWIWCEAIAKHEDFFTSWEKAMIEDYGFESDDEYVDDYEINIPLHDVDIIE
mgnify:FL=1